MIRDILDIMNPHAQFTLSGRYYSKRPDGPEDGAQLFNYEYVDPSSRQWRTIFSNIQGSADETAVRSGDQLSFKESTGIICLQDGKWYKIVSKMTDYQSAPKQAFRVLPVPVGTQYIIRLLSVKMPWEQT